MNASQTAPFSAAQRRRSTGQSYAGASEPLTATNSGVDQSDSLQALSESGPDAQ